MPDLPRSDSLRTATDQRGSAVWIPAAFVLLAAWFFLDSSSAMPEVPSTPAFDRAAIEPGARRQVLIQDPASVEIGGFRQRCTECHDIFESPAETDRELLQHTHIRLDHGLNNRCFNCHSRAHHDKLVLHGTQEIGFDQSVELCAKCHGPTFRDWERGMHGRTTGGWDTASAEVRRLGCIECHDPHAPAFPGYAPLPGPNTLRMSPPPDAHDAHGSTDDSRTSPLLRWLGEAGEEEGHAAPEAHEEHGEPEGSQH